MELWGIGDTNGLMLKNSHHPAFQGQFGIARTDITPPVGVYSRNWGAAMHDVADSIHRPLLLTVLTLAQAGQKPSLVFIDADLGWWKTPRTATQFRQRLLKELALPPENLIFALSHTHSGPPLMDADDSLPGSDLLQAWMDGLFEKTVSTVRNALADTFAGTMDWQTGRCNLATARDLPDPSGEDRILCGFQPGAEADDTLLLGRICDDSGSIRATLVNYACHPTTLGWENTAISPDYIGAMRETLQKATGAPAFFALGACGELAPRMQYVGQPEIADQHGRQLGFAALSALSGMEPPGTQLEFSRVVESGASLAVWKHEVRQMPGSLNAIQTKVELELKDWPTAEELEQERLHCTDRALEERLRRKRDIRSWLGDDSTFQLQISLWQVGEAIWVGTCCEAYSILQTELRRHFPEHAIVCMNLINGSIGYLPPAELYEKNPYTVWQTPFAKGSLERLTEAVLAACQKLIHNNPDIS